MIESLPANIWYSTQPRDQRSLSTLGCAPCMSSGAMNTREPKEAREDNK